MPTRPAKKVTAKKTSVKKKKFNWRDIFLTTFAIVMLGGAMVWMTIVIYQQEKINQVKLERKNELLLIAGTILDHRMVCMASDVYMREKQLSENVNGKIYFVCSKQCSTKIHNDKDAQVATDPYSKRRVSKAVAFISADSNSNIILYFESEENLKMYFSK